MNMRKIYFKKGVKIAQLTPAEGKLSNMFGQVDHLKCFWGKCLLKQSQLKPCIGVQ